MGGYSIRLAGPSACQELPLHPAVHGDITRELLEARQGCPPKFRAEDRYTPELLRQDGSPLGRFSLLINGQPLADTENVPLFRDAGAGLVRLGAVVEGELWESQWLAVVGKKASPGPALAQMIEQVYARSSPLYQGLGPELAPGGESSLLARVKLAWRILEAYRRNFPRFRDRGVYTVTPQAQLRSFQRLPAVSRGTLRYIACHPEELEPAPGPGGIRAKGRSWQPRRALAPVPKSSGDTEENRAVLNFLYTVAQSLERLRRELEALDQSLTAPGRGEEVCSHQALEAIFHRLFRHSLSRLPALGAGLWEQLRKYQGLLGLGPELLSRPPRPGAACLSLPHYREIFSLEEKWLRLPQADIREEKHLCAMLTSWVVYERYVLIRLLEQLGRLGPLLQIQRLRYSEEGLYANTECNNLFVFGLPGGGTAALYYQPKIGKRPEPRGLGLYRTGGRRLLLDAGLRAQGMPPRRAAPFPGAGRQVQPPMGRAGLSGPGAGGKIPAVPLPGRGGGPAGWALYSCRQKLWGQALPLPAGGLGQHRVPAGTGPNPHPPARGGGRGLSGAGSWTDCRVEFGNSSPERTSPEETCCQNSPLFLSET
nr:hypothetical protein [Acutalibacter muris]